MYRREDKIESFTDKEQGRACLALNSLTREPIEVLLLTGGPQSF